MSEKTKTKHDERETEILRSYLSYLEQEKEAQKELEKIAKHAVAARERFVCLVLTGQEHQPPRKSMSAKVMMDDMLFNVQYFKDEDKFSITIHRNEIRVLR